MILDLFVTIVVSFSTGFVVGCYLFERYYEPKFKKLEEEHKRTLFIMGGRY
jgi:hypothetical protein